MASFVIVSVYVLVITVWRMAMAILNFLLLLASLVCFGLATANFAARLNLIALGLLFWVLVYFIPALVAVVPR